MRWVHRAIALLMAIALGSVATASSVSGAPAAPEGGAAAAQAGPACTRDGLRFLAEAYFVLLAEHRPDPLPFAADLRYTENGSRIQPGQGFWQTAGTARFKRHAFDTTTCQTHTEAVVQENGVDVIYGVRIRIAAAGVTEIESYVTRQGDYFVFNPEGVVTSESNGPAGVRWESILPEDQRSTREELVEMANNYYESFGAPEPLAPLRNDCYRWENGFRTASGDCFNGMQLGSPSIATHRRYPMVDVEAGIVIGYVMFGTALDFHMFKVVDGQVRMIDALITASGHTATGWEDQE